MAHQVRDLIELWDRADRACEQARLAVDTVRFRLETSEALIGEHWANLVQIRDLITRSRAMLARNGRPQIRQRGISGQAATTHD